MHGAWVISLDFELHWGIRDHTPLDDATAVRMRRTRRVVNETLERFAAAGVAATWATVGFLFAARRQHWAEHMPAVRPDYARPELDPFSEPTGDDEASDPAHYGRSLVEAILRTPRQEVGTHTYAHYYCLDDRAGPVAFEADLASAVAIAADLGVTLRSIVFPRNQVHPGCLEVLPRHGIRSYRGNAALGGPGARRDPLSQRLHRSLRFADAYLPLTGSQAYPFTEITAQPGPRNVRASMFLRAHYPRRLVLGDLHHRRIVAGMRHAAREGRVFHLWWHPHNFAAHPERAFAFLDALLEEYGRLRDRYDFRSLTMDEAADAADQLA